MIELGNLDVEDVNPSNRQLWRAESAVGRVRTLVPALRAFGIEPTEAKAWEDFATETLKPPPEPARVLGSDPAVAIAWAERMVVRSQAEGHLQRMVRQTLDELQQSMREEANDYLLALQPHFDKVAAGARRCIEAGVQPTDAVEQIMRRGGEAVAAWLAYTDGKIADQLDRIASVRKLISLALGVPPINDRSDGRLQAVDYTPCFTWPAVAAPRQAMGVGTRRYWLHLAPNLHLTTLDELRSTSRPRVSAAEIALADARTGRDTSDAEIYRAAIETASAAAGPEYLGGF